MAKRHHQTRAVPLPSDRAWFDPRLLMANTFWQVSDVPSQPTESALLAKNSPERLMVGFMLSTDGGNVNVAPWPLGVGDTSGWLVDAGVVQWFSLFDYGPIVTNEWYCSQTSASVVRIIEVIRRTGGR